MERAAFCYCKSLESIVIPGSVATIGSEAFGGCEKLSSVTISEGVKTICDYAFYDCPSLTNLTIPYSVTTFEGTDIFGGTTSLGKVNVSCNWEKGKLYNFSYLNIAPHDYDDDDCSVCGDKRIMSGTWSENITYTFDKGTGELTLSGTGDLETSGIFQNISSKVKTTVIEDGITSIGYGLFNGCPHEKVLIPKSVKSIGVNAFMDNPYLKEATLPDGLVSIGDWAFVATGLTSVTIPNSVTSIGEYAFYDCPKLLDVYCYAEKVPSTGDYAFDGSNLKNVTLHVPAASLESYKSTSPWSSFANIVALPPSEVSLEDGVEYENSTSENVPQITYTRTLNNTEWNALYLPFEIPVSQLTDKYEVAYINAIHSYDEDDNGEIDRMSMEVIKLREGTLHANHPYLIKARTEEAKQMNITVENTTLHKAENRTLDCSSVYTKFEITGIYEKMTSAQLAGCYALSGGSWKNLSSGSSLNPFRLYLRVSSREGSPVKLSEAAMARIGIHVQGEETATSVEERLMQKQHKADAVYDLSGRRVTSPKKGQTYIVNGKKRMY